MIDREEETAPDRPGERDRPSAGATATLPRGAAMSMPRCPEPYGDVRRVEPADDRPVDRPGPGSRRDGRRTASPITAVARSDAAR